MRLSDIQLSDVDCIIGFCDAITKLAWKFGCWHPVTLAITEVAVDATSITCLSGIRANQWIDIIGKSSDDLFLYSPISPIDRSTNRSTVETAYNGSAGTQFFHSAWVISGIGDPISHD